MDLRCWHWRVLCLFKRSASMSMWLHFYFVKNYNYRLNEQCAINGHTMRLAEIWNAGGQRGRRAVQEIAPRFNRHWRCRMIQMVCGWHLQIIQSNAWKIASTAAIARFTSSTRLQACVYSIQNRVLYFWILASTKISHQVNISLFYTCDDLSYQMRP